MADTTPSLDAHLFARNFDALCQSHAHLAETFTTARSRMPEFQVAPTRDDHLNFRVPGPQGGEAWFGRTSIPRVRAAALVDQFQPGNTNVLLPGIGEGTEVELLLERLGTHRAVFVWEQDPTHVLLALRLHDFASALENGRLVIVLADQAHLAEEMMRTLEALPGHYWPDRILIWPWQTAASLAGCRSAIETVQAQVEQRRQARLTDLRQHLANLPARAPEDRDRPPTVALFAIHARDELRAWTDALAAAAAHAGWQVAPCLVRGPGDMHALARAGRLCTGLERAADFALLLDVCRAEIADVLPATTPAITWLSHAAGIDDTISQRIGPRDHILVADAAIADRLHALGLPADRASVRPLPLLATCAESDEPADSTGSARPIDVMLVDRPAPVDPQSYGFDLPTHTAIWRVAIDLLRSDLDTFHDGQIRSLLARAERKLGARMDAPQVRERMSEALAGPVAGTLVSGRLAHLLSESGLKVATASEIRSAGAAGNAATPTGRRGSLADRLDGYRRAKCVVFASTTGVVWPDVLLAVEAGAVVFWRAHPRDNAPGGLASLLAPDQEAIVFDRLAGLPKRCQRLLADPDRWGRIAAAGRQRCRSEHLPAAALPHLARIAQGFSPQSPPPPTEC